MFSRGAVGQQRCRGGAHGAGAGAGAIACRSVGAGAAAGRGGAEGVLVQRWCRDGEVRRCRCAEVGCRG